MEHENHTEANACCFFKFLEYDDVQTHFADLNIELLRGGHIQNDTYNHYRLLRDYTQELQHYYQSLYGLELVKETQGEVIFFYLDFPFESKGKIGDSSRHQVLPELQTIFGITLLNMYYDRYFDHPKEISLADIKWEFMESVNSGLYRKLWFNEVRSEYSSSEWETVMKSIRATIRYFEQLGWLKSLKSEDMEDDEIKFVLQEPILRFQKLYEKEIANFDSFVESYLLTQQ